MNRLKKYTPTLTASNKATRIRVWLSRLASELHGVSDAMREGGELSDAFPADQQRRIAAALDKAWDHIANAMPKIIPDELREDFETEDSNDE